MAVYPWPPAGAIDERAVYALREMLQWWKSKPPAELMGFGPGTLAASSTASHTYIRDHFRIYTEMSDGLYLITNALAVRSPRQKQIRRA